VWLPRISYQYLNAFSAGLLVAVGASALANFGHAVEYGQEFVTPAQGRYCVFGHYNVPSLMYSLAFGGILPIASLMFARILANTAETETEENPELVKAQQTIKELRSDK
jgi:hypothetical protein